MSMTHALSADSPFRNPAPGAPTVTLDLPAPIDTALLNERIQIWADALVASYNARYPNGVGEPGDDFIAAAEGRYSISVDVLRKYWRIVTVQSTQRFAHAFVDPNTGDVYKAAGWKAPAKGVRFNLLDDASFARMQEVIDCFGGYLYR